MNVTITRYIIVLMLVSISFADILHSISLYSYNKRFDKLAPPIVINSEDEWFSKTVDIRRIVAGLVTKREMELPDIAQEIVQNIDWYYNGKDTGYAWKTDLEDKEKIGIIKNLSRYRPEQLKDVVIGGMPADELLEKFFQDEVFALAVFCYYDSQPDSDSSEVTVPYRYPNHIIRAAACKARIIHAAKNIGQETWGSINAEMTIRSNTEYVSQEEKEAIKEGFEQAGRNLCIPVGIDIDRITLTEYIMKYQNWRVFKKHCVSMGFYLVSDLRKGKSLDQIKRGKILKEFSLLPPESIQALQEVRVDCNDWENLNQVPIKEIPFPELIWQLLKREINNGLDSKKVEEIEATFELWGTYARFIVFHVETSKKNIEFENLLSKLINSLYYEQGNVSWREAAVMVASFSELLQIIPQDWWRHIEIEHRYGYQWIVAICERLSRPVAADTVYLNQNDGRAFFIAAACKARILAAPCYMRYTKNFKDSFGMLIQQMADRIKEGESGFYYKVHMVPLAIIDGLVSLKAKDLYGVKMPNGKRVIEGIREAYFWLEEHPPQPESEPIGTAQVIARSEIQASLIFSKAKLKQLLHDYNEIVRQARKRHQIKLEEPRNLLNAA